MRSRIAARARVEKGRRRDSTTGLKS